jgi:hypothetical protein
MHFFRNQSKLAVITVLFAAVLISLAACSPASMESPTPVRQVPQISALNDRTLQLPLRIVPLTSPIAPQGYATIVAETLPGAECTIIVDYRALASNISSFRSQVADGHGRVSWTWQVGSSQGTWNITVKADYGGQTISAIAPLTIGNLQWENIPQPIKK